MTDNFITTNGRIMKAISAINEDEMTFYDGALYVTNPYFTVRIFCEDFNVFQGKNFRINIAGAKKCKVSDTIVISDDSSWENLAYKEIHETKGGERGINERVILGMKDLLDAKAVPFDGMMLFGLSANIFDYFSKILAGFKQKSSAFYIERIKDFGRPGQHIFRGRNTFSCDGKKYTVEVVFTTTAKI